METGTKSEYNNGLKSCPFCGGEAYLTLIQYDDGDAWYNPNCSTCNCGWKESYEAKKEAIKAWNRRV